MIPFQSVVLKVLCPVEFQIAILQLNLLDRVTHAGYAMSYPRHFTCYVVPQTLHMLCRTPDTSRTDFTLCYSFLFRVCICTFRFILRKKAFERSQGQLETVKDSSCSEERLLCHQELVGDPASYESGCSHCDADAVNTSTLHSPLHKHMRSADDVDMTNTALDADCVQINLLDHSDVCDRNLSQC
jgi:hypothetical protein